MLPPADQFGAPGTTPRATKVPDYLRGDFTYVLVTGATYVNAGQYIYPAPYFDNFTDCVSTPTSTVTESGISFNIPSCTPPGAPSGYTYSSSGNSDGPLWVGTCSEPYPGYPIAVQNLVFNMVSTANGVTVRATECMKITTRPTAAMNGWPPGYTGTYVTEVNIVTSAPGAFMVAPTASNADAEAYCNLLVSTLNQTVGAQTQTVYFTCASPQGTGCESGLTAKCPAA